MAAGYLKFKIGDACGVIPLNRVREVLPMADLARPPRRPPALEGFVNLGGRLTPVVRLDRALELAEVAPTVDSHLVLIKTPGQTVALLVERALACIDAGDAVVTAAPGRFSARHVRQGRETLFVLDVDQVLGELDRAAIAEAETSAARGRSDDAA